ncbi:hypothetical protein AB1283_00540 [Bacillus sp. S13(2024)]|uniref:homing endonuclease associated repeat-containing protein n=1 Tax=Bacillus sp. S13(2024) TaxID=3162885 RepID=UPI003D2024F8
MEELHFNSKHTDEELLDIMRNYAINVKFPTSREFKASNNLPCSRVYIDRFGSFQNAIIKSGILIPKERLRYFNREQLNDKTMLNLLKEETDKMITQENRLLTAVEINKNKNLPSEVAYHRRFGGLTQAYALIGYDINKFGIEELKEAMKEKYIELSKIINRTPTSRDLDEYSKKGFCHSASTYVHYFGKIDSLQKLTGLSPTRPARNKTKKEMIKDLLSMKDELGRTPTQTDLLTFPSVASASTYMTKFGSFVKALESAGLESNKHKIYYTKSGTPCYSRMEHLFAQMLDKYKFKYLKDEKYLKYLNSIKRKITCDFVVFIDNETYFVEIFGIEGNKNYDRNKEYKINICKENNIPLICLNLNDFWNKKQKDIYNEFINKINFKYN